MLLLCAFSLCYRWRPLPLCFFLCFAGLCCSRDRRHRQSRPSQPRCRHSRTKTMRFRKRTMMQMLRMMMSWCSRIQRPLPLQVPQPLSYVNFDLRLAASHGHLYIEAQGTQFHGQTGGKTKPLQYTLQFKSFWSVRCLLFSPRMHLFDQK